MLTSLLGIFSAEITELEDIMEHIQITILTQNQILAK